MARRGENIYKRKDGRWEGRYIIGHHPNGKARFGYIYDRTFREVRRKLREKKQQYQSIIPSSTEYQGTVTQWVQEWLQGSIRRNVKISTYTTYHYKMVHYVCPYFETISLSRLTTATVQGFVDYLSTLGLSATTIRTTIQILKRSLREAIKRNILLIDPFYEVIYPMKIQKKIFALTEEEQASLEKFASQHAKGFPIVLALHTGMRIGEISALKWTDIDLNKGEISVSRTLQRLSSSSLTNETTINEGPAKSPSAHRIIPLNDKIWGLLKEKQKTATSPYVVGHNQHFYEPRTITYQFKKILSKLKLRSIHFHQLRHTFATRLLEKGADIASVSALLGHHSAKLTLDVYIDSLMTQRKKWVNALL
ncbi:hypothetical protein BAU15_07545 [Enterococcus sp. JM4C]|uniref:tyrosine-type recombinase/integrase n=1 Tax=Candidatus Enterococcus huntleyi TaxID=1857217 RepID=UPI00137B1224|nr:site-specific integrase [Enterococcus sp. JM4C]KAF1297556.1 hypothetical protein BAU15_07545 [Enterococcus sp. JM4C]